MKVYARILTAVLVSGFVASAAFAEDSEPVEMTVGSPPMISDDTGTPGPKSWEINAVFDAVLSKDSKSYEVPLLDINYGVGETIQLKYEVPYVFNDNTGEKARGISNSKIGVKYKFYDNEKNGLSLAVYPQIEFLTPGSKLAGAREEGGEGGVAEKGVTYELPFLLTKEFGKFSVTANVSGERSSEDTHIAAFASLGAGTRLTDKLAILCEIAGSDLNNADEKRVLANLGFKFKLSDQHAIVVSAGRDIHAPAGSQKYSYATIAYQRFIEYKK
ncbi:MAG: hypothetical protein NTX59_02105 [Elusimicrobia bacterium]|nr:hypothetical protein [Elusimicrobiota bacterium]